MTDNASFGRRPKAASAAQPLPKTKPVTERPSVRPADVASGTPGSGLGVSVDMVLWVIGGLLVVAWFVLPDLDHKQWAVWGLYGAGTASLLNALRPRKK